MKKTRIILAVTAIIVALSSLVQISASNELSTRGIELNSIKQKLDALKKENTILKEQLYTLSSYNKIASDAASLGFIQEKSPLFVDSSYPIAIRQ